MALTTRTKSILKIGLGDNTAGTEIATAIDAITAPTVDLTTAQTLANKKLKSNCALVDATDVTKTLKWNLAAVSAGVDLTFTAGAETADRIINIPVLGATRTMVFAALAQTLESKILKSSCYVADATDPTKTFKWNLAAQNAGVDFTITTAAEAADRLINIPVLGADQTLAFCALDQVLENKKLEATCWMCDTTDNTKTLKWNLAAQNAGVDLIITSSVETADRIITIPILGAAQTFTFCALDQVLENKQLEATCWMCDTADNTKTLKWNLAAQDAGVDLVITSGAETADRVINIPVLGANQTFVFANLAQTLKSKSIDATNYLCDSTDITKTIKWDLAAMTGGVDITLTAGAEVADRILNIPVLGGTKTLSMIDLTQTVSGVNTFTAANVHYDTMTIVAAAATTKVAAFDCSGMTAACTMTFTPVSNASSIWKFDTTGITAGKYVSLKAANTAADAIITLPNATSTVSALELTQTVSGVNTFTGANIHFDSLRIVNQVATPKAIKFVAAGSNSTTTTITSSQTVDRAISIPDKAGTIAMTSDIGADVRAVATVDVSQADLVGLFAASKLLVAAPAAGEVIVVENIEILHTYAVAQYTGGGVCRVQYEDTAAGLGAVKISADIDAVIKAAATTNVNHQLGSTVLPVTAAGLDMASANIVAKGVYLSNATGVYADGNAGNVLKIRITYRVITAVA